MTLAEQFRQEGMQQGIQQGMQKVAISMLKQGYRVDAIVKLTELDYETIIQLRGAVTH